MKDRLHLEWTLIAGAIFFHNVLAKARGGKFATDYFRENPLITAVFLVCLACHLAPRRSHHAHSRA